LNLELLHKFETLSLIDLQNKAPLLEREDKKFVLAMHQINNVLADCLEEYQILKIENDLFFDYKTAYYDTKDLELYQNHHNGKGNRNKIRKRLYVNSGFTFVEIKNKNNKGKTIKHRLESDNIIAAENFITTHSGLSVSNLTKTLSLEYSRITLLHKTKLEKVTLDYNLVFKDDKSTVKYENVVIAEVKTEKPTAIDFCDIMKKNTIREGSLSKYCLGLISLNNQIKHNNFKHRYNKILKINNND
jgi:hypothetical protein